ncbi:MAG TPA: adenylate/guanylate cyclase domain-containing protein [Stellaceae bacterium]|nr:adenylate/guanylate cyclase domain-containing protein [Stellaceae bacterium]
MPLLAALRIAAHGRSSEMRCRAAPPRRWGKPCGPRPVAAGAAMIRRLRLGSGLLMLAYVAMHLSNHAVGLVSLGAMDRVLAWVFWFWSNPAAQALLYGSFLVHYGLALWALWERRTLRLRAGELTQLVLGFAIPILLVHHVAATRISDEFFATYDLYYLYFLWIYFVHSPWAGAQQMATLVVAWSHAMLGLHFWLKVRPWYARVQPVALVAAVMVPVLSLLGVIEAGRQVAALAADPAWAQAAFAHMRLPPPATQHALDEIAQILSWVFGGLVGAVLLARLGRSLWRRRHGLVRIAYPDGRFVEVTVGTSVLEASRIARIPHAHICGGRGRCSTCRVRVRGEAGSLDPPGEAEQRILRRIGATQNVRLACQLRPRGAVEVMPLLPPFAFARDGRRRVDFTQGSEREIAIMFTDIRGFTALSEGRLPYDVVFILNRYFAAVGRSVETAGGRVDKFLGDGVMALFGIEGGAVGGCRSALAAARLISERMAELNLSLTAEIDQPLRIGIGIHMGPIIIGEMGYGGTSSITAIGDAVNTASRLQELTKEHGCELVVSEAVVRRAGLILTDVPSHEIEIRGKRETLTVRTLASAAALPRPDATPLREPASAAV